MTYSKFVVSGANMFESQPSSDELRDWIGRKWPLCCIESEILFRSRHARLLPLVPCGDYRGAPTGRVHTIKGAGKLLSVSREFAVVVLDTASADRNKVRSATEFRPWQVWPAWSA